MLWVAFYFTLNIILMCSQCTLIIQAWKHLQVYWLIPDILTLSVLTNVPVDPRRYSPSVHWLTPGGTHPQCTGWPQVVLTLSVLVDPRRYSPSVYWLTPGGTHPECTGWPQVVLTLSVLVDPRRYSPPVYWLTPGGTHPQCTGWPQAVLTLSVLVDPRQYSPSVQCWPVQAWVQLQVYRLTPSRHSPSLEQGLEAHSFISEIENLVILLKGC